MNTEIIKNRIKIFKKYDEQLDLFMRNKVEENKMFFEETISTLKNEHNEIRSHLQKARRIIQKNKSNKNESSQFSAIEKKLLRIEDDLYGVYDLNNFYCSQEGIEIRKQYRVPNRKGFFEAIGVIGALELNFEYHLQPGEIVSSDIDRGVENYYSSRYSTITKNRFLKFKMNRKDIKTFCKLLLEKDEADFKYWLEDFYKKLKPPTLFDKPPLNPKYCFEIRANGIFNGLNEQLYTWNKLN